MQSPKKGTVKKSAKKLDKYIADSPNIITENRKAAKAANKKTAKKEPQSDRKLKDQAGRAIKDFKKGVTDSFKPIVKGVTDSYKPITDGGKSTGPSKSKRKTKTGYAPNQNVSKFDSKTGTLRYTSTNKKGKISNIDTISDKAFKEYRADPSGKVSYAVATKGEVPARRPDYKKSVDTTGYAAGKKEFTVNSIMRKPGELTKTKSTKITRKEVKPLLDRMKAKASKMKKGGMIKTKKK